MCKCGVEDKDEICDDECILNQKDRLSFHCPEDPMDPFLRVKKRNGDIEVSYTIFILLHVTYVHVLISAQCGSYRVFSSVPILTQLIQLKGEHQIVGNIVLNKQII